MWYGVALRELDRTSQARTFIYIGMSQKVTFYFTRSWNSELSSCRDRSLSGLVRQDLIFLWFYVMHKFGRLPHKKDEGFDGLVWAFSASKIFVSWSKPACIVATNVSCKEEFGESPVADVNSDTILAPFIQSTFSLEHVLAVSCSSGLPFCLRSALGFSVTLLLFGLVTFKCVSFTPRLGIFPFLLIISALGTQLQVFPPCLLNLYTVYHRSWFFGDFTNIDHA